MVRRKFGLPRKKDIDVFDVCHGAFIFINPVPSLILHLHQLILQSRISLDHFDGKIVLAFLPILLAVFLPKVRMEIPCEGARRW
ncbi:hypothetical protein QJ48_13545 [Paenibacillus sp. A3]|nr:hypothetical protein QJ48_13545 [Paenibacillus sp. A3]